MAPGHRVSARFTFRSSAELIDALAGERQTMPSINATFIDRACSWVTHIVVHLDVSPYPANPSKKVIFKLLLFSKILVLPFRRRGRNRSLLHPGACGRAKNLPCLIRDARANLTFLGRGLRARAQIGPDSAVKLVYDLAGASPAGADCPVGTSLENNLPHQNRSVGVSGMPRLLYGVVGQRFW
jgi:hypothetical protein